MEAKSALDRGDALAEAEELEDFAARQDAYATPSVTS
jgi:hypothetical protein